MLSVLVFHQWTADSEFGILVVDVQYVSLECGCGLAVATKTSDSDGLRLVDGVVRPLSHALTAIMSRCKSEDSLSQHDRRPAEVRFLPCVSIWSGIGTKESNSTSP